MGKSRKEYIYALKYRWLTPLYDPLLRLTLREQTFKKALVEQARIQPGQRVLRPGGELHVADWGKPQNALMRPAALLTALLDGYSRENVEGLLPELFRQAGLVEARQAAHYNTLFGTLALYGARKPA